MATKKTVIPPVVSTGDVGKDEEPKTKAVKKVATKKSEASTLNQVLGEIEITIRELTQALTATKPSKHRSVGSTFKPTPEQQMIQKELAEAKKRYDQVLKLIANG